MHVPHRGSTPALTDLLDLLAGHQAAGETLSANLTPSTAAGGADGARCTGSPVARAAATNGSLNAKDNFQFERTIVGFRGRNVVDFRRKR